MKDRLQIFCPTFNRANDLRATLGQLLAISSPVKDCEIIVLDNNSSDATPYIIREFQSEYPNVKTIRHHRNIGGNANITRAMELASKQYLWVIGDDDFYDFTHWGHVRDAIFRNEKVILLADYLLNGSLGARDDLASQLVQATFISGVILNTELLDDTVLVEAYNHSFALFPHIMPTFHHINRGGGIWLAPHAIATNGYDVSSKKDVSYQRGFCKQDTSPYSQHMNWLLGWSVVIASLKDKRLRQQCFDRGLKFTYKTKAGLIGFVKSNRMEKTFLPLLAFLIVVAPANLALPLRKFVSIPSVLKLVWFRFKYNFDMRLHPSRTNRYMQKLQQLERDWG